MNNLINIITPNNFLEVVLNEKKYVLLLCMPQDDGFPSQFKIITRLAINNESWIKAGIIENSFVEYFKKKLNVIGTPTFLIFFNGKEIKRLLGLADHKGLEQFVFEVIGISKSD